MNLLAAAAIFFAAQAAADEPARGPIVSVGIARSVAYIEILPEGEFSMIDVKGGEITRLERGAPYRIEADRGRLIVGKHLFPGTTRLLPGAPGERVLINGKKYRGNILFRPNPDETLTVIDELDLEDYLEGVLPKEMSPGWHLEALKAQAVVSRSFAMAKLGKSGKKGYDLRDDAFSQIYDGQNTDSERIRRAVRETAGQVLVYDGKLLPGYFHSTCAGRTTSPGSVWGSSAPTPKPLRGVRDKWCKISPHYKWTAYFRTADILKSLQRKGINALRISRIRP
ncbi:MAG: SpoIID/LytB domain-containing protein, partial [Elusimicrobiota bacterium]